MGSVGDGICNEVVVMGLLDCRFGKFRGTRSLGVGGRTVVGREGKSEAERTGEEAKEGLVISSLVTFDAEVLSSQTSNEER